MSPDTRIYIKVQGRKITLPVNPEEIAVDHPYVDKTAEVAGVGEILIPQKPGLREISFSSFLPGDSDDPYVHHYRSPRTIAKTLEKAWKNRTKCRLIISRSNDYDTNVQCVISDWKISDRGGEPDDLYYDIAFREYRPYGVQQMTVVSESGATTGNEPGTNLTAADGALSVRLTASTTAVREVETPQVIVGASVLLNGAYYHDASALFELGTANNESATIMRIDRSKDAPIYVSGFGWFKESSVQVQS